MSILNRLAPNVRLGVQTFIDRYNPTLTVHTVSTNGIKFTDELEQTVVVVAGTEDEDGYIAFAKANAEIFVITDDETLLGWVHKSSLIDAGDKYLMPKTTLLKMPKSLKFAQECPHLSYYGGFRFGDDKYMTCFGCGKLVVR